MEIDVELNQTLSLPIEHSSQIGEARRLAASLGREIGLEPRAQEHVRIAVTEAGNNLLRHARPGCLLIQAVQHEANHALECIALDTGPGMRDVARCLDDGYSTTGTQGTGLGAIHRLSHQFDIYSQPGLGTALLMRFFPHTHTRTAPPLEVGAVCLTMPGENISGDGWRQRRVGARHRLLVCDGLGHGAMAAQATGLATDQFDKSPLELEPLLAQMHEAMRRSRGAAVALAEIEPDTGRMLFYGIGNIGARVVAGRESQIISQYGTIGCQLPRLVPVYQQLPGRGLLILHSDGLTSRWDLHKHPGLVRRDPALVASVLYRDFKRGTDDAAVLVARRNDET